MAVPIVKRFPEGMMDKRELSYDDLMSTISQAELAQLATNGMLTDATLERCAHIGRFMQRLSSASPIRIWKFVTFLLRRKCRRCGKRRRSRLRTLDGARYWAQKALRIWPDALVPAALWQTVITAMSAIGPKQT